MKKTLTFPGGWTRVGGQCQWGRRTEPRPGARWAWLSHDTGIKAPQLCTWDINSNNDETQHLLWVYCIHLLPQFSSSLNWENKQTNENNKQ